MADDLEQEIIDQQQDEYNEVLNELAGAIALGDEVRDFFKTQIGRYLLDRAIEEKEAAFKQWQDIDPKDALAIRECQMQAAAPGLIFAWLQDAVTNGEVAREQAAAALQENEQ